ncbi:rhomboid family intramembrane serine protease [Dactylosporangium sp. NPDC000244]|uniref:rhomboid family intramembrane serine protease n=1 Tax=Dactylosporangium sp. NPDC000244 TaxID=3154365 RepID=UPI0033258274
MPQTVLYLVLLMTAGAAGAGLAAGRRLPPATAVLFGLVAVVSGLQLTVAPGLFEALRRDRSAIAHGEVWRLVTSCFVQDGGWPGTIFNLLALAVLGTMAERLWGTARWLLLALVVQVLGGLWGLVVQPVGGGTSLVDFGLAASLAVGALTLGSGHRPRVAAAVTLLAALALLVLGDIHGGAATAGAAGGALLALERRRATLPRWPRSPGRSRSM